MITTGKKRYSRLLAGNWQFFCCGGKFSLQPEKKKIHYDQKKKTYSRLSGGCAVLAITTGKKKIQSSVCWVCGSGDYDRKKKVTVVTLVGCAVVLFFVVAGNFHYDRKKKIHYDRKKKDTVVCLMGARFW